jgi:hypothetical protein
MSKGKIYCAHCIFTGKKYIGQTEKNRLKYRICEHYSDSVRYTHKFANALKKYGKDGFIWGEIGEYDIASLDNMEIFWIKKYDTFKNGYNTTTGGNQAREYCIKEYLVECPSGERKLIENLSQYCRDNDLNVAHLHETLYRKRIQHKGYKLIPRTEEEIKRFIKEKEKREDVSRKANRGEKNGRAKLDWNKVNQIRELYSSKKYKNQTIADMFGIKKCTIEKIVSNKLWTVLESST